MASDRWQLGIILLQLLCRRPLRLVLQDSGITHACSLTAAKLQALLALRCQSTSVALRALVVGLLQHDAERRLTDAGMEEAMRRVIAEHA